MILLLWHPHPAALTIPGASFLLGLTLLILRILTSAILIGSWLTKPPVLGIRHVRGAGPSLVGCCSHITGSGVQRSLSPCRLRSALDTGSSLSDLGLRGTECHGK